MSSSKQAQAHELLVSQTTGAQALKHATSAAELYLAAAAEAQPGPERTRLRAKCRELLTIAEALKSAGAQTKTSAVPEGAAGRPLTARERAILVHASNLHGTKYPPWTQEPGDEEFCRDGELFTDDAEFSLSPDQLENLSGWKRPAEIIQSKLPGHSSCKPLMKADCGVDLAQDITTDCSVVASLSSALRNMKPGKDSLLAGMIYPFNKDTGLPAVSDNGKYIFRFHFNGCARQVVIDDRLPATESDRTLYVIDLSNPRSIWPALVEKAYLKLRGGYDFPGSNSCTDLWVLTGWIPEQVFLQKEDLDLDQIWDTIVTGFRTKTVIITLGTGRMSHSEEKAVGLVSEHDYGVLQLDDVGAGRRMLVKNPWCNGPAWASVHNRLDSSLTAALDALSVGPESSHPAPSSSPLALGPPHSPPDPPAADSSVFDDSRAFWVTFEQMTQNFESMYLNWNPSLFKFRQDHHFMWNVVPEKNMSHTVFKNPQFKVSCSVSTTVWILLARHHRDEELALSRARVQADPRSDSCMGYMSLVVARTDGARLFKLPKAAAASTVARGDFVDSHHSLTKATLDPGSYTVVPLHDRLPLPAYSFTLSFFSMAPLTVTAAPQRRVFWTRADTAWTRRSAGGNASFPSYTLNPQYEFTLPQPSTLSLLLACDATDIPLHMAVLWSSPGQRAHYPLPRRVIVGDSREYTRRSASIEHLSLDAGTYAVVCSTFQPNQFADFSLLVGCDAVQVALTPVPAANAGKLPVSMDTLMFAQGTSRARVGVSSQRLARANAMMHVVFDAGHAGTSGPSSSGSGSGGGSGAMHRSGASSSVSSVSSMSSSSSSFRLSVVYGSGPAEEVVAVSGHGEFQELKTPLATEDFDIEPGRVRKSGLWIVVERIGGRFSSEAVQVELFSDALLSLGQWEITD
ncbi:hypothetical protein TD95_005124 [Thielaviopsis punctulata]|uniref:Calpain catalytic domain-containing protein n=1 Tax=Thielaviopsis punctulata TaxID=72032 RepID=A0A0F4ZFF6_9PEZI|nr:hypothetical protein TD95_005124 [Thielaviopsis punctulata]